MKKNNGFQRRKKKFFNQCAIVLFIIYFKKMSLLDEQLMLQFVYIRESVLRNDMWNTRKTEIVIFCLNFAFKFVAVDCNWNNFVAWKRNFDTLGTSLSILAALVNTGLLFKQIAILHFKLNWINHFSIDNFNKME